MKINGGVAVGGKKKKERQENVGNFNGKTKSEPQKHHTSGRLGGGHGHERTLHIKGAAG